MFTAHDRAGHGPGNEATLRAFRAHKQRWRAASFPFNNRCAFGAYVRKRVSLCVRKAMKGSILPTPLLCHFSEERGEFFPISGPNASSGPFLQILHLMEETDLHSAGFERKYLLKLKKNSKQGDRRTTNGTKAGVGLKLHK